MDVDDDRPADDDANPFLRALLAPRPWELAGVSEADWRHAWAVALAGFKAAFGGRGPGEVLADLADQQRGFEAELGLRVVVPPGVDPDSIEGLRARAVAAEAAMAARLATGAFLPVEADVIDN